jgi:glycosyltransferase involved in cell wall biosynthesis
LSAVPDLRVRVVVVDNDASGSARQVVEAVSEDLSIRYVHEPTPGLAWARNRAVAEAGAADAIAFIDDDEVAEPGWLAALVRAQRRYSADAVGGPVVPCFPNEAPRWLRQGRFLQVPRDRPPSGSRLDELATNNALVTTRVLASVPGPFDESFNLSGGEDSVFFRAAHRQGFVLVWADDAVVTEEVPVERMRLRWVLRRAFREGSIVWRRSRRLDERRAWLDLLRAVAVLAEGLLCVVVGPVRGGSAGVVAGLHRCSDGLGRLAAAVGVVPEPYR